MRCYENIEQLSDRELLSLTLKEGQNSVVLDNLGNLIQCPDNLLNITVEELMKVNGIGKKKAIQLKATLELGRRLSQAPAREQIIITNPSEVAGLVQAQLRYLDREHFKAILLNRKNGVISIETISIGGLSSSLAHPREIFKPAIKKSAAAIILVHNHPSGDPTPSKEDIETTKRLQECGHLLGIEILDHVIIGDGRWSSLKSSSLF